MSLELREMSDRRKFRLTLRVVFIVAGVVAAYLTSLLLEHRQFSWSLLPAAIVLIASIAEFVVADILTENKYPARTQALLDKLEEDLEQYHDRIRQSIDHVISSMRACDTTRMSGTFHLVVDLYSADRSESEKALLQVTAYSGQLGGRRWRFTAQGKGVIGRCLRSAQLECVNFGSLEEYEDRMVREFGFSAEEITKHTKEARSYLAQPVRVSGSVVGVLYLFSTEPQVFPRAAEGAVLEGVAREIGLYLLGAGVVDG